MSPDKLKREKKRNPEKFKLKKRNLGKNVMDFIDFFFFFLNLPFKKYMKSSFPKRYKSILIVFMKMIFFYLDPYILLIFNLSC